VASLDLLNCGFVTTAFNRKYAIETDKEKDISN